MKIVSVPLNLILESSLGSKTKSDIIVKTHVTIIVGKKDITREGDVTRTSVGHYWETEESMLSNFQVCCKIALSGWLISGRWFTCRQVSCVDHIGVINSIRSRLNVPEELGKV